MSIGGAVLGKGADLVGKGTMVVFTEEDGLATGADLERVSTIRILSGGDGGASGRSRSSRVNACGFGKLGFVALKL